MIVSSLHNFTVDMFKIQVIYSEVMNIEIPHPLTLFGVLYPCSLSELLAKESPLSSSTPYIRPRAESHFLNQLE